MPKRKTHRPKSFKHIVSYVMADENSLTGAGRDIYISNKKFFHPINLVEIEQGLESEPHTRDTILVQNVSRLY